MTLWPPTPPPGSTAAVRPNPKMGPCGIVDPNTRLSSSCWGSVVPDHGGEEPPCGRDYFVSLRWVASPSADRPSGGLCGLFTFTRGFTDVVRYEGGDRGPLRSAGTPRNHSPSRASATPATHPLTRYSKRRHPCLGRGRKRGSQMLDWGGLSGQGDTDDVQ
ncbi:hypothetical protein HNY73_006250 [Argiope bruennichi]|uniref:Uncharacterized protein n=1 Tax=Argiope bruennichi TaxID=94029 RepID=A0A8T0FPI3_ARGBR|nr:hypothetical protein HNY73_006250 [Argiope bruennichi]